MGHFDHDALVRDMLANMKFGQTWKDVSEETGVHRSSISRIINGTKKPSIDEAFALCRYYGLGILDYFS